MPTATEPLEHPVLETRKPLTPRLPVRGQAPVSRKGAKPQREIALASWRLCAKTTAKKETTWLYWVAILTFPSFVFFVLYAFFFPADLMPVGLGPALGLAAPGLFGASMTFAGLIVSVNATLKGVMTTRMVNVMWSVMALSLAGWLYVWISLSILPGLPPFVPF